MLWKNSEANSWKICEEWKFWRNFRRNSQTFLKDEFTLWRNLRSHKYILKKKTLREFLKKSLQEFPNKIWWNFGNYGSNSSLQKTFTDQTSTRIPEGKSGGVFEESRGDFFEMNCTKLKDESLKAFD